MQSSNSQVIVKQPRQQKYRGGKRQRKPLSSPQSLRIMQVTQFTGQVFLWIGSKR